MAGEESCNVRVNFKPACGSDLPHRHVCLREEAREVVHPATVDFIHRCAAKIQFESVLQRRSGEAGGQREIRDPEIPIAVLPEETQGPNYGSNATARKISARSKESS